MPPSSSPSSSSPQLPLSSSSTSSSSSFSPSFRRSRHRWKSQSSHTESQPQFTKQKQNHPLSPSPFSKSSFPSPSPSSSPPSSHDAHNVIEMSIKAFSHSLCSSFSYYFFHFIYFSLHFIFSLYIHLLLIAEKIIAIYRGGKRKIQIKYLSHKESKTPQSDPKSDCHPPPSPPPSPFLKNPLHLSLSAPQNLAENPHFPSFFSSFLLSSCEISPLTTCFSLYSPLLSDSFRNLFYQNFSSHIKEKQSDQKFIIFYRKQNENKSNQKTSNSKGQKHSHQSLHRGRNIEEETKEEEYGDEDEEHDDDESECVLVSGDSVTFVPSPSTSSSDAFVSPSLSSFFQWKMLYFFDISSSSPWEIIRENIGKNAFWEFQNQKIKENPETQKFSSSISLSPSVSQSLFTSNSFRHSLFASYLSPLNNKIRKIFSTQKQNPKEIQGTLVPSAFSKSVPVPIPLIEVDFLISLCYSPVLNGYPPWILRNTEIMFHHLQKNWKKENQIESQENLNLPIHHHNDINPHPLSLSVPFHSSSDDDSFLLSFDSSLLLQWIGIFSKSVQRSGT